MILSCSACSTRYLVDPAVLGPDGREVRCAKCGHQWLQMPPKDAPQTTVLPPLQPEIRAVPEQAAATSAEPAQTAGANLPAISRGAARGGSALAWTVLVIVIGIFVGGFAARNEIAEAWPPAAKLYETLGLRPSSLGTGIELRNVASKRQEEGGVAVLVVEGEVANVSSTVRQVPKMRASLRVNDREVQNWTFQAVQSRLLPGESAPFLTRFKDPSPEATNLTITFTEDN